ncbi:MAG: hypothetical protein VYA34_17030 [Myxococcota bacterium]|nr:hypothetical protein [Myxococcota bacterium]
MKRHHHSIDSNTDSTLRLDPTTASILRKLCVTPENGDFSNISCEEFDDSIDQHMNELALSSQLDEMDWFADMSTNVGKAPQLPSLPPVFQQENQWFAASVNDERFTYRLSQKLFTEKISLVDTPTPAKNVLEVAMLWRGDLVSVSHFKSPKDVFVGTSIKNDFRAPTPTESNRFCLLSKSEETFVLNIRSSMKIAIQDSALEGGDLCWYRHKHSDHVRPSNGHLSIHMDLHDRICVGWNDITFIIQYVAPARIIRTSLLKSRDDYFIKVMSLSFIGHLFFLIALLLTPLASKSQESTQFLNTDRFPQIIIKPANIGPKPKNSFTIDLRKSSAPTGATTHKSTTNKEKIRTIESQSASTPNVDEHNRSGDLEAAKKPDIFNVLGGAHLDDASAFGNEALVVDSTMP